MAEPSDPPSQPKPATALFKKRSKASTANLIRKRRPSPPPDNQSSNDPTTSNNSNAGNTYSSDDDDSSEDNTAQNTAKRIKRAKKSGGSGGGGGVSASSGGGSNVRPSANTPVGVNGITADRSAVLGRSDDATRQSNWLELDSQAKARERETEQQNTKRPDAPSAKYLLGSSRNAGRTKKDNSSAGASAAPEKEESRPAPAAVGPQKAPSNMRAIHYIDMAPDVCKDYKQTGFCGFGDSCKFLHAREDYKAGWELDRDWEVSTKGKKQDGTVTSSRKGLPAKDEDERGANEDAKLLESIPFACIICKGSYDRPVVTTCGHYFCEKCALQRYRKTPNCAACGEGTGGVFNSARMLKRLLERKKERERRKREVEEEKIAQEV